MATTIEEDKIEQDPEICNNDFSIPSLDSLRNQMGNSVVVNAPKVENSESAQEQIDEANRVLAPLTFKMFGDTLVKSEDQKRALKFHLLIVLDFFIFFQFFFLAFVVFLIVGSATFNIGLFKSVSVEVLDKLLKFLPFYITSVIAELIAMLFFVVRQVFDTTLKDLMTSMMNGGKKKRKKKKNKKKDG